MEQLDNVVDPVEDCSDGEMAAEELEQHEEPVA